MIGSYFQTGQQNANTINGLEFSGGTATQIERPKIC
jgi:hypothetical protein